MRDFRICAAAMVFLTLFAPAALADALDKAIYMSTYYCVGVAEIYSERLGGSHRGEAGKAATAADRLRGYARNFGRRLGFSEAEGKSAEAKGRRTMATLLPSNGAWSGGGSIPQEAYRQYEHCASLAGLQ